MKTPLAIISTFILLFFQSCDDSIDAQEITGQWKLIETLADPGDGSGTYIPYEGNQVATIFADSSISFTEPFCYSESELAGLEAQLYVDSIHWPDCDLTLSYELLGQHLFMYPPCIEPCGLKFEKIED